MEFEGTSRRSKRSSSVRLSAMLSAAGSMFLAGCGDDAPAPVPQATAAVKPGDMEVQAFENVFECAGNTKMTQDECAEARKQAVAASEKVSPRYAGQGDCESEWGGGSCVQQTFGGASFFAPFVTGFLLGKLLPTGKREFLPLYRKSGDTNFSTANGARLGYGGAPGKYFTSARALELPKSAPAIKANSGAIARGGMAANDEQEESSGRRRIGFGG